MQQSWHSRRLSIITFITELWSVGKDALVQFVWSDLRSGLIDLRDLSRPVRAIIVLGFVVTTITLFLLTQAAAMRSFFPFHTSVTPAPGRGLHIPILLFPLSLFLLSLAWAYLLTGARYSHWRIRWGVLFLYTLSAASWLVTLLATNPSSVAIGTLLYSVLLVTYLLPQASRLRPTFLFALTLICVGGLFAAAQLPLVLQDHNSGLPIGKTVFESNLRSLATFAIPLLILIGLDIADFTVHASTWLTEATTRLLPTFLFTLLTIALLLWLLWQGLIYLVNQQTIRGTASLLAMLCGSFGLILLLWLTWLVTARLFPRRSPISLDHFSRAAGVVALSLVIAFLLPLLTSFLMLEIAQLLESLAVQLQSGFYGEYPAFTTWAATVYAAATAISSSVYTYLPLWQRLCAWLAVGAALLLYRRNHFASALYAITVGVNYLWVEVTRPGQWLQSLGWTSPEPVVVAWVLPLIVWSLLILMRRKFTASFLRKLLFVTLLLVLLRQTNLIAAPLDPLFSLAGVGYLAVGLGWDLLTAGSWANNHSKALPRSSRIFLYLGYIILTVMLVNWMVAAHDLTLLDRFTGEAALTGLSLLGYPYLFSVIYLTLTDTPTTEQESQPPGN